jgi:hypothetical protein
VRGGKIFTPRVRPIKSQASPLPICRIKESGLYWVRIPMVLIPEFIALLSVKSIILKAPPNVTAGFAREATRTFKRLPTPPANNMTNVFCIR